MENLLEHLGTLALKNPEWTNFILAASMLVQGEIAILLAVYLVVSKHITFLQFLIAGLSGLFIGEFFIYSMGKMLRNTRLGWKFYRKIKANRRVQIYTYYLKQKTARVLLLSKFLPAVPGVNALTLLLLGWTKTKWGQFLKIYIPCALFWFGTMSILSYFISSGLYYLRTANIFKNIELIILLIIVLFFIVDSLAKKIVSAALPKDIEIPDEE